MLSTNLTDYNNSILLINQYRLHVFQPDRLVNGVELCSVTNRPLDLGPADHLRRLSATCSRLITTSASRIIRHIAAVARFPFKRHGPGSLAAL
jgi:hypothetical protein